MVPHYQDMYWSLDKRGQMVRDTSSADEKACSISQHFLTWLHQQDMYQSLDERGQLIEESMDQLFSEALGKFLPDRFVYGTCPKCAYEV